MRKDRSELKEDPLRDFDEVRRLQEETSEIVVYPIEGAQRTSNEHNSIKPSTSDKLKTVPSVQGSRASTPSNPGSQSGNI